MRKLLSVCGAAVVLLTATWLTSTPASARNGTKTATPAVNITVNGKSEKRLLNPCTNKPFTTIMTNAGIESANAEVDQNYGNWVITFKLADNDDAHAFSEFTASNIGQAIAIVLDGKVYSAPVISAALTTTGQIAGKFTEEEAAVLARLISTKPLPASFDMVIQSMQGDKFVAIFTTKEDIDAETFDALVEVMKERVHTLDEAADFLAMPDIHQMMITLTLPDGDDQKFITDYLTRAGLLEFVDFSKPSSCTKLMPDNDEYILTDYQQELYGK